MSDKSRREWGVKVQSDDCPYFGMMTDGGCGHQDGPRRCQRDGCPIAIGEDSTGGERS
jgi:hypothetical protein